MDLYVITVEFTLKPGTMRDFRRLIDQNALDSCRDEPGCQRFDVLAPLAQDDRFFSTKSMIIARRLKCISRHRTLTFSTERVPRWFSASASLNITWSAKAPGNLKLKALGILFNC